MTGCEVDVSTRWRYGPTVVVWSMMALAVGCSGSSDDGSLVITASESRPTPDELEFLFSPADVVIPAGEEVQLEFINDGEIDHEWVIMKAGILVDPQGLEPIDEENDVLNEVVEKIGGGERFVGSFRVDEPGTYQLICALPGHIEHKMVGSLRVELAGGST